jgi:hypothetical protein
LEHARVAVDRGNGGGERAMQVPAGVAVAVEVGGGSFVYLAEGNLDQPVDDRALVGEVEVERGAADERAARDRVDRDALVGILCEGLAGGIEDRCLGVVAGGVGRAGDRESLRARGFSDGLYAAAIARQAF